MGPDGKFSDNFKAIITNIFKELRKNTGFTVDLRCRRINNLENRLTIQSEGWRTQS